MELALKSFFKLVKRFARPDVWPNMKECQEVISLSSRGSEPDPVFQ